MNHGVFTVNSRRHKRDLTKSERERQWRHEVMPLVFHLASQAVKMLLAS